MATEIAIYTVTMARLYEEQGHFDRAAAIYEHMLKETPGRPDLIACLSAARCKSEESRTRLKIEKLFAQWVELLLISSRLQRLKEARALCEEGKSKQMKRMSENA